MVDSVKSSEKNCTFADIFEHIFTMETITLQYNANNPAIKGLIAALLKFDDVVKVSKTRSTTKRNGLDEAIDDFKNGRTTKCRDFDDYMEKINA